MMHYMMDRFFQDAGKQDGLRKESCSIGASSDSEAIREAQQIAGWEKPIYFHVRAVAGKNEQVIYRSNDT